MIVDIFIPCYIDQFYPQTAFNMVKILESLNMDVNYVPEQTCCGQITFNSGYWKKTRKLAEKFINDFKDAKTIVVPSASCVSMIKNYYPELFHNSVYHNQSKQLSKNIYEITDFIVNVLKKKSLGATFEAKVSYHESCSAKREYGLKEEPRILLNNVNGLELVEMEEADVCCGFGGTFSVKNEAISTAMAEQKVNNAIETGASYVTSTEASCLMHLEGYIKKNDLPIKTIHIVDVLGSSL